MPLWKKFTAGLTSGAIGAAVANPTDLVKVRMQAHECSTTGKYSSTVEAFRSIYRKEGLSGLFKGVGPTTQRAALLTATQLATYDHIKHTVLRYTYPEEEGTPGWKEPRWTQFVASVFAGFFCSVVTSPIDLIKTRVMNQPVDASGRGTVYSGTMDCAIKTLKNEGPLGLYKGFFPNWFRIGPHTIVAFIAFEQLRRMFGLRPI